MKSNYSKASLVLLALVLNACGAETTPFKDVSASRYAVTVNPLASSNDATFPIDDSGVDTSTEEGATDDKESADNGSDSKVKKEKKDKASEDKSTLSECSKHFKGKASKLAVLSADSATGNLVLDADTVIAVRLSGNQQNFELNISGVERVAGVCILATGNQPKVSIVSDVDLGYLLYMGRGNKSAGSIVLSNSHKLESSFIELKGNGNTINLDGVAQTHCDNAVIKGNAANSATCKAPVSTPAPAQ